VNDYIPTQVISVQMIMKNWFMLLFDCPFLLDHYTPCQNLEKGQGMRF